MRREIIRYEPFIGNFLVMYEGEYYQVPKNHIQDLINELDFYIIIEFDNHPVGAFSMPIKAQIQVTKKCNLQCITCAVAEKDKSKDMGYDNVKKLLEYLSENGILNIEWSGGEPFMVKNFLNLVKYAWKLGFEQNLLTNGLFFNKKNIDIIKQYFFRIQVSIDGVDDLYNKIVGCNAWERYKKSISLAASKKIEQLVAATVLQESNVERINEIAKFCVDIGIPRLRISMQVPIGRSSKILWEQYKPVINSFREKWPAIKNYSLLNGLKIDCFLEKTECKDSNIDPGNLVSPGGYSFIYIDANGDYYPFPFLTSPNLKLGSFFKDNLKNIWLNSKSLNFLRKQTYKNTGCENCRMECSFHERALVYAFTGKLDAPALQHKECIKERR